MMEVFVSKDGEKHGPFQVFELKTKVDAGEYSGDDLAWFRGMEEWLPLREIEALEWIVEELEVEPPPLPEEAAEVLVVRPWVRFWARTVDWQLLLVVIGLITYPFGGFGETVTPMVIVSITFGWGLIEAWMLSRWGTTPGKQLLGIRVEKVEEGGGVPAMGAAVKRGIFMVLFGYGMGLFPLTQMAWVISYIRLKQWGRTLWDEQSRLQVRHGVITQKMVVQTVVVMILLFSISTWMNWDEIMQMKAEMEAQMEQQIRGGAATGEGGQQN